MKALMTAALLVAAATAPAWADIGFGAHMTDKGSKSFQSQLGGYESITEKVGNWFSNKFGAGNQAQKMGENRLLGAKSNGGPENDKEDNSYDESTQGQCGGWC